MPDTPMAANRREEEFYAEVRRSGVVWALSLGDGWLCSSVYIRHDETLTSTEQLILPFPIQRGLIWAIKERKTKREEKIKKSLS